MPRMRTLKPEFWGHPDPPSYEARLLYMAMWNWADDYGIGDANPKALAGFAFPYDDDIDHHRVEQLFSEIAASYDVTFYRVNGRRYYAIGSWTQHQRPKNPGKPLRPGPDRAESILYQRVSRNRVDPTPDSPPDPPPSYRGESSSEFVVRSSEDVGGYVCEENYRLATRAKNETSLSPPVPANATRLVEDIVPAQRAKGPERVKLRIKAAEILAADGPEFTAECLREWVSRDKGPELLPSVAGDVRARRYNAANPPTNGHRLSTRDAKFAKIQAMKTTNPARKEITNGDGS